MTAATTLRALIREYLFVSLFRTCAESLASENASRLAAMQRADKNIDELLENLDGTFHRLRQNGIDEELFDVISGFEALVGPQLATRTRDGFEAVCSSHSADKQPWRLSHRGMAHRTDSNGYDAPTAR